MAPIVVSTLMATMFRPTMDGDACRAASTQNSMPITPVVTAPSTRACPFRNSGIPNSLRKDVRWADDRFRCRSTGSGGSSRHPSDGDGAPRRGQSLAPSIRAARASMATKGSGSSLANQASVREPRLLEVVTDGGTSARRRRDRRENTSRCSTIMDRPTNEWPAGIGRPVRSRWAARTTSIPVSVSNTRNCAPMRGLKSSSL